MYFRELLRTPHVPRLVASSLLGRLPDGMTALALILLVHEATGSFAVSGLCTAAFALTGGCTAPLKGRWIDRRGQAGALVACALVYSAAFLALASFASDLPAWALVTLSGVAGAGRSPLGPSMRALWPRLVPADRLEAAYAFESTSQELIWITGPLLVGAGAAALGPASPVYAAAVLTPLGTLGFVTAPPSRAWRGSRSAARGLAGPLRAAGVRAVLVVMFLAQVGLGSLFVAIPAFAERDGSGALAGPIVAAWSIASMAGGFMYASGRWRRGSVARRFLVLLAALALSWAPLVAAASVFQLAAMLALSGLTLAPLLASTDTLTQSLAPPEMTTEAFTWLITAGAAGQALGGALAGAVTDSVGPSAAFFAAFVAAGAAAGLGFFVRGSLQGT
jgi:MFS family permease